MRAALNPIVTAIINGGAHRVPYFEKLSTATLGFYSNIGTLTSNGGLAASFDGSTNVGNLSCSAPTASGISAYAGKNFSSAPYAIQKFVLYGSNNLGYLNYGGAGSVTLRAYGKNYSAPSSPTDGTLISTLTFTQTGGTDSQTLTSTDQSTLWDYVWIENTAPTSYVTLIAEIEIYAGR